MHTFRVLYFTVGNKSTEPVRSHLKGDNWGGFFYTDCVTLYIAVKGDATSVYVDVRVHTCGLMGDLCKWVQGTVVRLPHLGGDLNCTHVLG